MSKAPSYKSEAHVKRDVKKLLDKHDWYWWMPPSNMYGRTGISDFNALRAGVFLVVETKFGYNKPTAMQQAYMQSITAEGGFAFVVNEVTIFALGTWLELFDKSVELAARGEKMLDEDGAQMLEAMRAMTEDLISK